ncbi:hypothetical protein DFQ30_003885 [Apophysomyces sp. BC1015]|nr:hypothetical protein DFQ30_003885 [Apophysomyces sp. BC1015]
MIMPAHYCTATLDLGDFTTAEIGHFFDPCACDPGLTNVYVAAYGGSTSRPHSVRQFTSSEYYSMLKTNKRSKKLDEKKKAAGINIVEQEMPSSKTTDLTKYNTYVGYFLGYLEALGNFYNLSTTQSRFQGYQLRQRAREEMANILIDGGLKYGRAKRKKKKKLRKFPPSNNTETQKTQGENVELQNLERPAKRIKLTPRVARWHALRQHDSGGEKAWTCENVPCDIEKIRTLRESADA